MQAIDKFIGFVDILGFKSLVRASEAQKGLTMRDLSQAVEALGTEKDLEHLNICPVAPRLRSDLDFQITQVSDCVFISAECSPAGVINLVSHCWRSQFKLLKMGIMCRGYIKRGLIYHTKHHQIGTGLSEAVDRERAVSVFKQDANERGTPFVEIDREVVEYVAQQPDACVKEMFSRHVETDGDLTALFPFKRLNHSFAFGSSAGKFDADRERASVNVVRGWIRDLKAAVSRHVDQANIDAVSKGNHYLRMLDAQLEACDKTEQAIDFLMSPLLARRSYPL